MKIKTITYSKVFNLGNYSNEKIGCEIELAEIDDPVKSHMEAVNYVERAHLFQNQLPHYHRAKEIVKNPKKYTGYDVEEAQEAIAKFELQYSVFLKAYNADEILSLVEKHSNTDS